MAFSSAGSNIPRGYKAGQLQQYTPQQMSQHQSLFPYVSQGSDLARMASGDLGAFAPQEELAKRQFQEFEGDLSSRFSGAGMGARKSSGFHNLATQGAQDFALQLSAQRQQLQRQALMDLFGLSESLLGQKPYEQFLVPKKKSFWEELLGGLSSGIGSAAGTFTGLYGGKKAGLFKE